jgi:hypothetical protein
MPEKPDGYCDYTVYPLEGVWDLNEQAKKQFSGMIGKDDLVYTLMIRQPDFVIREFFEEVVSTAARQKPEVQFGQVSFETIAEGRCIQMLHVGSYDDESVSFERMEKFAEEMNLERSSKRHREIYLSDFRKVTAEKLKTVLRFKVK